MPEIYVVKNTEFYLRFNSAKSKLRASAQMRSFCNILRSNCAQIALKVGVPPYYILTGLLV